MDIKKMTKEELITLKKDITEELNNRILNDYEELEKTIIKLIRGFEAKTGYYVVVDNGEFTDTAVNFIRDCFYYTDNYTEPFE